jgi:hypothetical protein
MSNLNIKTRVFELNNVYKRMPAGTLLLGDKDVGNGSPLLVRS